MVIRGPLASGLRPWLCRRSQVLDVIPLPADDRAFALGAGCCGAIVQGAGEIGPRALGHRSILANPCDPAARERLIRRLADATAGSPSA